MNRLFDTHHFRQSRQAAPVWNMTPLCADRPAQPVKVCVPGTWESIPGMGNYRGKCLYEQKFDGCGNMRFHFEGVSFRARVLVDGKELATHYGAYTGFDAIAPELESGTHLLQVEADNSWGDDSALHIPNDYYSYGGITRPVLIENIGDAENNELMHYLNNAIRARGIMQRDIDYVVQDGKIVIVDSFTGRIMPNRRFSNGLHQAIEAKEGVAVQNENRTQATITFQNYFRMYKKLSGMTGTALTEEDEFREIYSLDVVEIPTNKPMIRLDRNDVVYKNISGKIEAIIKQIEACRAKGQPVLVGTVSVEKSEALSKILKARNIP
ncbi:MAG: hypothetical protein IJ968_01450, partial [Clostridia bacterium]|nr:hypothetical protein [Clostridia bacterium]